MANQHGGFRVNSGRKNKGERNLGRTQEADAAVQEKLPDVFSNLCKLADGGLQVVREKFVAAGSVTRKDVARHPPKKGQKIGDVILDAKGKPTMVEVLVYPDRKPDDMVLDERTIETLAPDRAANTYLFDRGCGRSPEAPPKGDPSEIDAQAAVEDAHARRDGYVDPDEPEPPGTGSCTPKNVP